MTPSQASNGPRQSVAMQGNTNALRFKTPMERKAVCEEYCVHLKSGKTKRSFRIRDNVMKDYLRRFPEDFPPETIEEAEAACAARWEENALAISDGRSEGNPTMTIFGLKNIAGWRDKIEIETRDATQENLTRQQKMLDTAKKIAFILRQGINTQGAVVIPQPKPKIEHPNDVHASGQTVNKNGTGT